MWSGVTRTATHEDLFFLNQMLYLAICWDSEQDHPTPEKLWTNPSLKKLLQGWGRPGDVGVIAVAEDGLPIGAAWYRYWTISEHSYGFVDEATPELGVAVVPQRRGEGIGHRLILSILAEAFQLGTKHISLSVAPSNPALRLYKRLGFHKVGISGNSWTMLIDIDDMLNGRKNHSLQKFYKSSQ